MNIFNNKSTRLHRKFFSIVGIFSLFCYLFFGLSAGFVGAAVILDTNGNVIGTGVIDSGGNTTNDPNSITVGSDASYRSNSTNNSNPTIDLTGNTNNVNNNNVDTLDFTDFSVPASTLRNLTPITGNDPPRAQVIDESTLGGSNSNSNSNSGNPPRATIVNEGSNLPITNSNGMPINGTNGVNGANSNSTVITPNSQNSVSQNGPSSSANCGLKVSDDAWKYCLLAPMNGLIGDNKKVSGLEIVEISSTNNALQVFFAKIYGLGITAAVGLSIVMISFGGIQMATTDSITGKSNGKDKINAAFAGLFIALFSYVLLYTINPALVGNGVGTIFPANAPPVTSSAVVTPTK